MLIGVCAIIKDSKPLHLEEWIAWHKKEFDYIIIYDNESKVPIQSQDNIVVYQWKGRAQQLNVYYDQIKKQEGNYKYKCHWMAFIDDDEFIVAPEGIKNVLGRCRADALGLNWILYGSSGITTNEEKTVLDRFTKRCSLDHPKCRHIKSIVRMRPGIPFPCDPHWFRLRTVDVYGREIRGPMVDTPSKSMAWINHYITKSRDEWIEKVNRGRADITVKRALAEFEEYDSPATIEDGIYQGENGQHNNGYLWSMGAYKAVPGQSVCCRHKA